MNSVFLSLFSLLMHEFIAYERGTQGTHGLVLERTERAPSRYRGNGDLGYLPVGLRRQLAQATIQSLNLSGCYLCNSIGEDTVTGGSRNAGKH